MGGQVAESACPADLGEIWSPDELARATVLLQVAPREPHEAAEDVCQSFDVEGAAGA